MYINRVSGTAGGPCHCKLRVSIFAYSAIPKESGFLSNDFDLAFTYTASPMATEATVSTIVWDAFPLVKRVYP